MLVGLAILCSRVVATILAVFNVFWRFPRLSGATGLGETAERLREARGGNACESPLPLASVVVESYSLPAVTLPRLRSSWLERAWLGSAGVGFSGLLMAVVGCGTSPEANTEAKFEPLSCRALPSTCGVNQDESCCVSLKVPGGAFNRSNDPMFPAEIADFSLDKYEVTVGRFRKFVDSYDAWRAAGHPGLGEGSHPLINGTGWDPGLENELPATAESLRGVVKCDAIFQAWSDAPAEHEQRAMNCIDSLEAFAFCLWDGARLPTEAEWNYAAAGGDEQRSYPWGEAAPNSDAMLAVYGCSFLDSSCKTLANSEVGSLPRGFGRYGHADLAGGVFEWNLDYYAAYGSEPCVNCANTTPSAYRSIRGGYFGTQGPRLATSYRSPHVPDNHIDYIGIRCARDLKP